MCGSAVGATGARRRWRPAPGRRAGRQRGLLLPKYQQSGQRSAPPAPVVCDSVFAHMHLFCWRHCIITSSWLWQWNEEAQRWIRTFPEVPLVQSKAFGKKIAKNTSASPTKRSPKCLCFVRISCPRELTRSAPDCRLRLRLPNFSCLWISGGTSRSPSLPTTSFGTRFVCPDDGRSAVCEIIFSVRIPGAEISPHVATHNFPLYC